MKHTQTQKDRFKKMLWSQDKVYLDVDSLSGEVINSTFQAIQEDKYINPERFLTHENRVINNVMSKLLSGQKVSIGSV